MNSTVLVQKEAKIRALALLSVFSNDYTFDHIEFGFIEPDFMTGNPMAQWGAIRIDYHNFKGMSQISFRRKAKQSFVELGFPAALYATSCPRKGSQLFKKDPR